MCFPFIINSHIEVKSVAHALDHRHHGLMAHAKTHPILCSAIPKPTEDGNKRPEGSDGDQFGPIEALEVGDLWAMLNFTTRVQDAHSF